MILARERSEWARLRVKGLASIWAPDSSHVGNAGVGVISMRGASVALPLLSLGASLTAVVRSDACCIVGAGRFMHLVVLYGILMLSSLLYLSSCSMLLWVSWECGSGAALFDGVVDFNVEPTKIPCLAKAISAGVWVDLEAAWALACGGQPAVTGKRTWGSASGHRRDFMVGCTLCRGCCHYLRDLSGPDRWIVPHLAVRTHFECSRWTCRVTQPAQRTPWFYASFLVACCR